MNGQHSLTSVERPLLSSVEFRKRMTSHSPRSLITKGDSSDDSSAVRSSTLTCLIFGERFCPTFSTAGLKCRSQVTGQVTGYRLQATGQVTGQVTGHRSDHRPQVRSQVTHKNNRTLDKLD